MENERKIKAVYEFVGPLGPLPNGVDYTKENLIKILSECSFSWHNSPKPFLQIYKDLFGYDVPVFENGLPISDELFDKISIYEIDRPNSAIEDDKIYIFPIGVFGSMDGAVNLNTDNKTVLQNLSKKTIDMANNNENFFIFINHTEEGFFDKKNILSIFSDIKNLKIKEDRIVIGTSCYNPSKVFEKYLNKKSKIKFFVDNWAIRSCSKHWFNILKRPNDYKFYTDIDHYESIVTSKENLSIKRNSKFLSFNNKNRKHRLLFLTLLNRYKELDENLISYDFSDLTSKQIYDDVKSAFHDFDALFYFEEEFKPYLDFKENKRIVDIDVKKARGHGWERKNIYLDSYINLTTETLFFEDCYYMSEKIFKPIANLQPFINIGSPFTLKKLKNLGFKTFSNFWDESYDDETNPMERFKKLDVLISKLIKTDITEIHEMYQKMIPILVYNQKKLLDYRIKQDFSFLEYFGLKEKNKKII